MRAPSPAQEEWEKVEERYHHLVRASHEWLWEVDRQGRYTYASARCRDLLGYEPEELIGKKPFDLMPPAEARRVKRLFAGIVARREPFQRLENVNLHKEGRRVTLETNGVPIFDRQGRFQGYRGLDRDITEHKHTEAELQDNLRFLHTLLDAIASPVFYKDTAGRYLGCNQAFEQLLGVPRARIIGQTVFEVAPSDLAETYHRADLELMRRRGVQTYEGFVAAADGTRREFIFHKATFEDAAGRVAGLIGAMLDITERKRAEEALRESEERYRRLVEVSPDAIYIRRENRVVFVNNAGLRLFGASRPEQLLGKSSFELFHTDYHAVIKQRRRRMLQSGQPAPLMEARILRLDGGTRAVEVASAPFAERGGTAILVILHDISERKLLEKEILDIADREQQRIGQDLHDGLCQYLSGAKFRSSLLEHKLKDKDLAEAGEAKAIEGLLSTAIHQARNVARGLHPVLLDGHGLMSALEELARTTAGVYGIACACRCRQPVLVHDHAVATQLYRIAQEAINNAIRHGHARKIGLGLRLRQGRIILTIRDDGVGLPRKMSRKTGMGLRNMHHRARTIGGALDVRPGPKRGTTVTCWLRSPDAKPERRKTP